MKKKETDFKDQSIDLSNSDHQDKASGLFSRAPDQKYLDEWTTSLKQGSMSDGEKVKTLSVVVFRLGQEWLALPTIFFKEVTSRRPVHIIPHRTNKILRGIINLNGELKLFVALDQLLEIDRTASLLPNISYQKDRMIAIKRDDDLWVFAVDEIDGIYSWEFSHIEDVPSTIKKSTPAFIKGIFRMNDKSVGLLDEELLFLALKRSIP